VSRTHFFGVRCCVKDEGGPFGAGLQEQASNDHRLLLPNGSGGERYGKGVRKLRHVWVRETNANEPLGEASKQIYRRHQNRSSPALREGHGGNLPIGHVVSGVQVA
jgi:hypothetical protein